MEKMPYRAYMDLQVLQPAASQVISSDWRQQLPILTGKQVTLRELRMSDAASLFAMLTTAEVARFLSPPPTTVEGFERFIGWANRQRAAGCFACFAVTIHGFDTAIGIFQVREFEPGFITAEWGFALGSPFWGTGVFQEAADLVLEFAFETVGVHRLEARAVVQNGRGNGALRKVGAVQEGVLRRSFLSNGEYLDQMLYGIVEDDWRAARKPADRASSDERVH
jgi:RimJ/RimL family protein N-acetyltransferase